MEALGEADDRAEEDDADERDVKAEEAATGEREGRRVAAEELRSRSNWPVSSRANGRWGVNRHPRSTRWRRRQGLPWPSPSARAVAHARRRAGGHHVSAGGRQLRTEIRLGDRVGCGVNETH
ncbi:unnamed protein product, partial [Urochloa humidicola]